MTGQFYTMGVDVGGSYVKAVLVNYSDNPKIIDKHAEKIRKRDYIRIFKILIRTRLIRFRGFSTPKRTAYAPVLAVQVLLDSIQFLSALNLLCRGKLQKVWRDTKTTSGEVNG